MQILIHIPQSWYDVFNSRHKEVDKAAKCAYGMNLELQNKILKDFSSAIENLVCSGKPDLIDFQYGIITCSNALPMLFIELKIEYPDVNLGIVACALYLL